MRKKDELLLPAWAPWLVLLPVAVIAVDLSLHYAFGWHDKISDVAASAPVRAEAAGRTRVLSAILPFLLVTSLILGLFARDYLTLFGRQVRRGLLVPILIFGGAALSVIVMQENGALVPQELVGKNFIAEAFHKRETMGGVKLTDALELLVDIFRVALMLGAGAVIAGTISCLAVPAESLRPARRAALRAMQRRRLDTYLYASAVLLVSGLFFIDSCFRWPAPFSTEPVRYAEHVNALMLSDGIMYSTIIASYYIPVALFLRTAPASAQTGGEQAVPAPGEQDTLSPSHLLKAFLAMIAPAVAGS